MEWKVEHLTASGSYLYNQGCFYNGKFYLFGGYAVTTVVTDSFCYDPLTKAIEKKKAMPIGVFSAKAVPFMDKIFVIGGTLKGGASSNTVQVYDPATDAWVLKNAFPIKVANPYVVVHNGNLYVFGGETRETKDAVAYLCHTYRYLPESDQWERLADMPLEGSYVHSELVTFEEKIYVFGGITYESGTFPGSVRVFRYEPAQDNWEELPNMPKAVWGSITFGHNKALVGGFVYNLETSRYTEINEDYFACPGHFFAEKNKIVSVYGANTSGTTLEIKSLDTMANIVVQYVDEDNMPLRDAEVNEVELAEAFRVQAAEIPGKKCIGYKLDSGKLQSSTTFDCDAITNHHHVQFVYKSGDSSSSDNRCCCIPKISIDIPATECNRELVEMELSRKVQRVNTQK